MACSSIELARPWAHDALCTVVAVWCMEINRIPSEDHPQSPKHLRHLQKVPEDLVKARCEQYGIDWTIIRPLQCTGSRDNNKRVVSKFFALAKQGLELL